MFKKLFLVPLLSLSACTTVTNPTTGFSMPWFKAIPYDTNKPGAPSSAHSGVSVYTGTVNGHGVSVIVPR